MIAYLEDQTPIAEMPTNCLSVFGHFVGLALKGLRFFRAFSCCRTSRWKSSSKIKKQTITNKKLLLRVSYTGEVTKLKMSKITKRKDQEKRWKKIK